LDGNNIIAEYRGATLWAQYVHDAAIDSVGQIACQGEDHYFHRDLTSVRVLSNRAGARAGAYRYDCFGQLTQQPALYNPSPISAVSMTRRRAAMTSGSGSTCRNSGVSRSATVWRRKTPTSSSATIP
jgi:hypothetical protein